MSVFKITWSAFHALTIFVNLDIIHVFKLLSYNFPPMFSYLLWYFQEINKNVFRPLCLVKERKKLNWSSCVLLFSCFSKYKRISQSVLNVESIEI